MPTEAFAEKVFDKLGAVDTAVTKLLTNQEHVMHDLAEVKLTMKDFMPRAEIAKDHGVLAARIVSLEEDRRKIVWTLVTAIGAGVSFAAHTLWQLAAHAPVPR
jgi:hypothetical protein